MIIFAFCVFLGTFVGYKLSSKYKKRYLLYKECQEFFHFYKLQIGFSREKIKDIVNKFISSKDRVIFPYEQYVLFLNNTSAYASYSLDGLDFLKKDEIDFLKAQYLSIGKYSVSEEMQNIDKILNEINVLTTQTNEQFKKYSSLYLKLGLIVGAAVGLIFL